MRRFKGCRIVWEIIIFSIVRIVFLRVIARMRMTVFSPSAEGMVETRKLAVLLPGWIEKRPSRGKRVAEICGCGGF